MSKKNSFYLLIISALIPSCTEFFEPSLEDKKVVLTAPADQHESNKYNQTFWWEAVSETKAYRLQIATPSFDSIAEIVIDTLVKTTRFSFTLDPGKYQWRVRAENSASHSLYITRTITIHESSITTQTVQVIAPAAGLISNQDLLFKWNSLYGSSQYRLQIDINNFANESKLVFNSTTPNTEFSVSLSKDRTYQWRLRAETDSVNSKWTAIRSFTYDATPPEKVGLVSPSNNQVVSKPVTLSWSAVIGAKRYQLYIYKEDGATLYNSSFPANVNSTSYTFNDGEFNERIFWKVRAIDEAGNDGPFSDLRQFTIQ